jgi:hypothetical protein
LSAAEEPFGGEEEGDEDGDGCVVPGGFPDGTGFEGGGGLGGDVFLEEGGEVCGGDVGAAGGFGDAGEEFRVG